MHPVITDTPTLAALCERLAHEPYVTVDTEFMREKTYYPQLCLVQIAGSTEAAAIDPMAANIDLAPLYTLLANPSVLKVFHACRQDMEIFYYLMGKVPAPIFDTQIAAMVCGYGESIGYESLVNKVLNQPVDKSSRFTDWAQRPLSPKQLAYALDDVLHLYKIYPLLMAKLVESGRVDWPREEMEPFLDAKTYDVDPDEVWRKLRLRNTSPRYLATLQAIARWREETARKRNIPRGRIIKDEIITEIAQAKPENFTALQAIRGFYPTMSASHYDSLFIAIKEVESLPSAQWPRLAARPVLTTSSEALADMLRLLLKGCAGEHHVVPRMIADKEELEALALGVRENIHALHGWRNEIFGKHALRLLAGKIALKADDKNGITFIDIT